MIEDYIQGIRPLVWSESQRLLGAVPHSSTELDKSHNGCIMIDSTVLRIVVVVIINIMSIRYATLTCMLYMN